MANAVLLDVSDLEPPEPFERSTAAAAGLAPGEYLVMVHRMEPRLLYPWLAEHGFRQVTRTRSDGMVELLIWRTEDAEAEVETRRRAGAAAG